MTVTVFPGRAAGRLPAPPSKSYAHRMLICAALAPGHSVVHGISQSQDMLATLDCLSALGVTYHREGDTVTVQGGAVPPPAASLPVFPCRESGSTLRFFLPLSLACAGGGRFEGTARLMERGIDVYETLFAAKGVSLTRDARSITVCGRLTPGDYTIRGDVSSQFVTGLLFALPLLDGGDSVLTVLPPVESRLYIDITVDVLRAFGMTVEEIRPNTFRIPGRQTYRPRRVTVEGDWSNAAFLHAMNHLGGQVEVTGLRPDSLQGDRICLSCFEKLTAPGAVLDISDCPDLGPILFVVAAAAGQGATFTGTRRLRIKESDRAVAMAGELAKFGADMTVEENTVRLAPASLHPPTQRLHGHNDHRVVMSLAVLCTRFGGSIDDAQAVNKSYPDFFADLARLGVEVTYEA